MIQITYSSNYQNSSLSFDNNVYLVLSGFERAIVYENTELLTSTGDPSFNLFMSQ